MLAPDAAAEVADDELEAPEWVMDEGPADDEAEADAADEIEAGGAEEDEDEDAATPSRPITRPRKGLVSLSEADFDELRGLGMSVTQAKRVIRYREERGGF